jgi:fumarylacetoacetate (FAA) hydrolase
MIICYTNGIMKLVTLLASDRTHHIGALFAPGKILDFYQLHLDAAHPLPPKVSTHSLTDMVKWIEACDALDPWAHEKIALAVNGKAPSNAVFLEEDCILLAPVPKPISCRDGYAFRQHVESARRGRGLPMIPEFDDFPIFYFTNHLAITGPGEVFVMEKALERLDFELEVAIVTKKEGRNIPANQADDYIYGYMIMNDWSARELQTQEMKLNLGPAKGKDFATSLGPYLVTRDELASKKIASPVGERYDLRMQAFHNGKQVSDGNLKDMTWTFAQILERVSYGVTIYPGEVIGSGTVGTGCYMELNVTGVTQNVWIKPNDDFALEVAALGRLENTIRRAQ